MEARKLIEGFPEFVESVEEITFDLFPGLFREGMNLVIVLEEGQFLLDFLFLAFHEVRRLELAILVRIEIAVFLDFLLPREDGFITFLGIAIFR